MTDPLGHAAQVEAFAQAAQLYRQRIENARGLWRDHIGDCADCHEHSHEPSWTRCLCAVCEIADALDVYEGCQL